MKKEKATELLGQRIAFGEHEGECSQERANERKIGHTSQGPGHYEPIQLALEKPVRHTLPAFRRKPRDS